MNSVPQCHPSYLSEIRADETDGAGDERFPWGSLVSRTLHHVRVEVIEALIWVGLPLAASDLSYMSDRRETPSFFKYHLEVLEDLGIVEVVDVVQVRGTPKHFYRLVPESRWP